MRKAILCLVIVAMSMLALPASASAQGCVTRGGGVQVDGYVAAFRVEGPDTLESDVGHGPVVLVPLDGGEVFVGQAETLNCVINGASNATVIGSGTWNGEPVTFGLFVSDDSDETTDFYSLSIFSDGDLVFSISNIPTRGDIIVHGGF